ncbi:MAG: hypothetical protein ACE5JP_12425 [Candidatus Bipolaricaulia bacterium]
MKLPERVSLLLLLVFVLFADGCINSLNDTQPHQNFHRDDGAYKVDISQSGSLQNPAWSPDGKSILFTRFRRYNEEPADLLIIDLESNSIKTLVTNRSGNVNLPGSTWNPITHKIVFSSSREPHDEIFIIDENGNSGDEIKITGREDRVAYEPSLSPDGQWVVFESHQLDVEDNGIITRYKIDRTEPYQTLTDMDEDCRQPNWSPAGNLILYQKLADGQWDIWVMNTDGTNHRKVTSGAGDKTDASFSPDGQWIIYSSDAGRMKFANLFIIPVSGGNPISVTHNEGYDGAPSWSSDGNKITFESYPGDPDSSDGTTIWIIDVPMRLVE